MCGRFALSAPSVDVYRHYGMAVGENFPARYNIAPGQAIAVVPAIGEQGNINWMRWGLIPHWAKESRAGYAMINARSETLHEKPTFKDLFRTSRCLIPATGFYEWKKMQKTKSKHPFYITLQDESIFSFGGLWSTWTDRSSGESVRSCTIITTEPNSLLENIHDRMPVIIDPDRYDSWLAPGSAQVELTELFVPYAAEHFTCLH